MENLYNARNPAVKRLFREAQELKQNPDEDFHAAPLEDNLFEWHFTVRGPSDTAFENGLYHGRIILPTEYPMKPPNIIILTPNGRFETNTKICLSISGYHPETWQPSWSIRTALKALIGFMPTAGAGAIGSLDLPDAQRKELAQKSLAWVCPNCLKTNKEYLALATADVLPAEEKLQASGDAETVVSTVKEEGNKPPNPFNTFAATEAPSRPAPPSPESASGDISGEDKDFPSLPPRPRTSSFQKESRRGSGKRARFVDEVSPPETPPVIPATDASIPYSFPPRAETPKPEVATSNIQPGTALASASTEEMRVRQAEILKERQKVLRDRMAASGSVTPETPSTGNVAQSGGTLRAFEPERIERCINSLQQSLKFIAVCLLFLIVRRLASLIDYDDDISDMEF